MLTRSSFRRALAYTGLTLFTLLPACSSDNRRENLYRYQDRIIHGTSFPGDSPAWP